MDEERKVYNSFHDIPPREYMYFPEGSLDAGKPGRFSRIEITHLIISMVVLTTAFAFALSENSLTYLLSRGFNLDLLTYGFLMSFLGITTAFFFHELAHKFTAQRYGLWSEFRMFPSGLLLALFLGVFIGFPFAAPGAVMFMGGSRSFETGRIAAAGPTANIIIAAITLFLYLFVFYDVSLIGPIVGFICLINAFLAAFNLLPFGPLDGVKIIRWNVNIWILLFIIAVGISIVIFPKLSTFML
jgi:Zn-dependent protease